MIGPVSGVVPTTGGTRLEGSLGNIMDKDDFLQLLVAQMRNQDPMNPMDNSEILSQISQIREISASDRLTETLDAVLLGQNMTTASSLIGKQIRALSDATEEVEGTVQRVTVDIDENDPTVRLLKVHVGEHTISLINIREVVEGDAA